MIEEYITYKKFNNKSSAEEFRQLLEIEKVDYTLENNSLSLDATITGNDYGSEFCVKIKKDDFKKIDEILLKKWEEDIQEVPDNY
ncbi:hypothetical protein DBR27_11415, partial [Flavobacterium sp. HMWF030]